MTTRNGHIPLPESSRTCHTGELQKKFPTGGFFRLIEVEALNCFGASRVAVI